MKKNSVFDFSIKTKEQKKEAELAENLLLIADEIYRVRIIKKISQTALAKKVNTTQAIISRIESGEVNVGFDLLLRISKSLNIRFSFGGFSSVPETKNKVVFTYSDAKVNLEEKTVRSIYEDRARAYDYQEVGAFCY